MREELSVCEAPIMKIIWESNPDISVPELVKQLNEQYGKEYKEWNMDVLPMMPKHWKLTVLKKTSKQFQTVKKLLLRNDIKDVIIATDAGREGELVARWILQMSGNKKPIYRLWISSVTDKAIKDGFAHLKQGKEYDNLFRAARSTADKSFDM